MASPFDSKDFARYMHVIRVEHSTLTLLWPQGSTEVEAFMKPLGKALATAQAEQPSWSQELSRFLLSYHTTLHSSTKGSTSSIDNRQVRGKLPMLNKKSNVINRHREARRNDAKQKQLAKQHADTRRRTKPSGTKENDTVLVQQEKQNKLSPRFSTTIYTVVSSKGTRVIAENANHRIVRNASFFKKVPREMLHTDDEEELPCESQRNQSNDTINSEATPEQLRRSGRVRKQTQHYGQLVDSSLIG